jgi:hypothetical protein
VVKDGRISLWQVFADTPFRSKSLSGINDVVVDPG